MPPLDLSRHMKGRAAQGNKLHTLGIFPTILSDSYTAFCFQATIGIL